MAHGLGRAAPVVAVDVRDGQFGRGAGPARTAAVDRGHPEPADDRGEFVVGVQREGQHPVHMAAGQIAGDPVEVAAALHQKQHQLGVVQGKFAADATDLLGEERVGEDPELRLVDDHGDCAVAPGDQGPGGVVRYVSELLDRLAHLVHERLAHPRPAVHHPGDRRPGDPGAGRHGLQCGAGIASGIVGRTGQGTLLVHAGSGRKRPGRPDSTDAVSLTGAAGPPLGTTAPTRGKGSGARTGQRWSCTESVAAIFFQEAGRAGCPVACRACVPAAAGASGRVGRNSQVSKKAASGLPETRSA